MKPISNKSKKSSSSKTNKKSTIVDGFSGSDTASKPRYSVEQISNGFILEKSWSDGNKYHSIRKYHETNPLEDEEENE